MCRSQSVLPRAKAQGHFPDNENSGGLAGGLGRRFIRQGGEAVYQALYRKWRPKVFEDMVGRDAVSTVLRRQIMEGKVSHAYLFTGTRGTGKTTCSKILAKAVNCPHTVEGNPCLVCDSCQSIENGSAVDVVEIDAASNNSVDNIRDLKEEAAFTPVALKYRVYIIDEVHMLSIGAFNALLKLMEEPPPHVIFILATTEVHKIPATILSRCQRFDFGRIDLAHIEGHLNRVAAAEGATLTPEGCGLLAKLADGAMRDALTLLDQCMAASGEITGEVVAEVAGLAGDEGVIRLAGALCRQDVSAALEELQALYDRSVDLKRLCADLTACFRNLMVLKTTPEPERLIPVSPEELAALKELAQGVSLPPLLAVLGKLQELSDKLPKAAAKRTEFEMAVVRICTPEAGGQTGGGDYQALLARIHSLEAQLAGLEKAPASQAPRQQVLQAGPGPARPAPQELQPEKPDLAQPPDMAGVQLDRFPLWEQALQTLSSINPPLWGTLHGSCAYVKDDILLVQCENALFRRLIREDDNAKASLRRALFSVSGKKFRLGPYTPETVSRILPKDSPLDEMLRRAREAGVQVEEKG